MKEYHLRKVTKVVSIYMQGSAVANGSVFLNEYTSKHSGPERVSELLANDDLYIPFQKKNGELLIVRKAIIYKIVVDADYELEIIRSYGKNALKMADVVVTLTNGKKEKGKLVIEAREASNRASDELNREPDFMKLIVGKKLHLVGTRHVAYVRELRTKTEK